MNIISLTDILDCNHLLEERGLAFRVHLRDACGKQSCWIEPLGECACSGRFEEMRRTVEAFFAARRFRITYGDEEKLTFWVD
ncbi:hypothetical protein LJB68_05680 [bacterium 210820-DFI.6.52]|uniref:Uncharacterized protein n=1 Tax=Bittarella massiliensis (ex Durand et al. 2017) TaxID=1720313 RepID=A0AAQ1MB87_9FIRM|nr:MULTISPECIES: hypothetical protein [Eubacteriales]MCB5941047.1 hypothetical protein [bacterium 210820-DFI.6.52]ERI99366.1 hypothetical protein HMPREF0262_01908 [Clostridium sp. ATCC 29733]MZL68752.1 hypothetical protein [Bittarella massiliensis (ex Durand et al. 2017)]MZL81290.1 hypothetical protein [Bittarella massiliensis (ex Durand et al. 2017)]SHF70786.1 hypothetical protein SAMN05444424_0410 [Bittarella massiliensis (ex Durand et al. 2017)]